MTTQHDTFAQDLHAAGRRLAPSGSDAECIRLVAEHLGAPAPTVKRWWYGLSTPRGAALAAIRVKLSALVGDTVGLADLALSPDAQSALKAVLADGTEVEIAEVRQGVESVLIAGRDRLTRRNS